MNECIIQPFSLKENGKIEWLNSDCGIVIKYEFNNKKKWEVFCYDDRRR